MATITLTAGEWKKIQREITQLKKRVERLEKRKTTRRSATGKRNDANGHRKRAGNGNRRAKTLAPRPAIPPESKLWNVLGTVTLGYPTGSDNESIDRDLAAEYGSTHTEE